MGSKYGYKAAKKRPKTSRDIIRDGFLMTRGLYQDGYPWPLPTDITIDKVTQALLDHLLSLPELWDEEGSFDDDRSLYAMHQTNLKAERIRAALQRELGSGGE